MPAAIVSSAREWQELASRAFVPLECTADDPGFFASIRSMPLLEYLSLAEVRTGPVVVQRSARHVSQGGEGSLLLIVQLEAAVTVHQDGRSCVLGAGDASILDTGRPYEISADVDDQCQLVVTADASKLMVPRSALAALSAQSIPADFPLLTMMRGVHRALDSPHQLSPSGNLALARTTGDLLSALARELLASQTLIPRRPAEDLVDRCANYIRQHASDPRLTVDSLARAHHVSPRTLHAAFASVGTTPAAFVRSERLRLATELLATSRPGGATISSVAQQSGFGDATTFARAFRRLYGVSPSAWQESR